MCVMFYKELKVIYWLLSLEAEGKWCFKFKNKKRYDAPSAAHRENEADKKCMVSNSLSFTLPWDFHTVFLFGVKLEDVQKYVSM